MNIKKSIITLFILTIVGCSIISYATTDISVYNFKNIKEYNYLEKDYKWYVDQYNTRPNPSNNCGASVIAMIAKYKDENINPYEIMEVGCMSMIYMIIFVKIIIKHILSRVIVALTT